MGVATIVRGLWFTPCAADYTAGHHTSAIIKVNGDGCHAGEYAALAKHIAENRYINGTVIRLDGALRMAPR